MQGTGVTRSLYAVGLTVLTALAGCSAGASPAATDPSSAFVGRVDGIDAFVGLVTRGSEVVVYVCDGTDTTIGMADWVTGTVVRNSFELTLEGGGRLAGTIDRGVIVGVLRTSTGDAFPYRAVRASQGAGLIRAEGTLAGVDYVAGWIVLADGQQRGGVKSRGTKPVLYQAPPAPRARVQTLTVPKLGAVNVSNVSECRAERCPCPPAICRP